MNESTFLEIKKTEPSIPEQTSLIILTKEEQTSIKGGATCNCKTTEKRIKRR